MPLVTALPTPPSRANPATFSADADAFLAALSQFATEVNAVGQAVVVGPMAVAAGTADAITANFTPDISLTNGQTVLIRAGYANATTTPTFSPDGLTAHTIVKGANQALIAGDIAGAGHWLQLQYDSVLTAWVLQNPADGHSLTVAQFNNSTQIATTAFVQRALGNFAGSLTYNANATQSVSDFGKLIYLSSASQFGLTTPPIAGVATGASLTYANTGTANVVLTANSGAVFCVNGVSGLASITVTPGQTFTVVWDGTSLFCTSGAGSGSFAASGYQKLPGGLIIQWGSYTSSIPMQSSVTITLPTAFPNAIFIVIPTPTGSIDYSSDNAGFSVTAKSTTQFTAKSQADNAMGGMDWISIGY